MYGQQEVVKDLIAARTRDGGQLLFEVSTLDRVKILRDLGYDVQHIEEHFPGGTDDEKWLPVIGQLGWILITGDHNIKRRKAEKQAFEAARLISFFVSKEYNNKHATKRIAWILNQWEAIHVLAAEASPGDTFTVPFKGKITKTEPRPD